MRYLLSFLLCFVSSVLAEDPLQQKFEQTYTLEQTGTMSVENIDGSIRIYCWSEPEVRVEAIKKAYSAERLSQIAIDVAATSKSLAIKTKFSSQPGWWSFRDRSGTVDYTIIAPQSFKITNISLAKGDLLIEGLRGGIATARLWNGGIAAHNSFGDLHLRVANGSLDIFYDWWEEMLFSLDLAITNGGIHAVMPGAAKINLDAETVHGNITSDFGKNRVKEGRVKTLQTSAFGESAPKWKLRSVNGNIRLEAFY
jgi:DUF4097 and DUF4098 domain-containing protein YvlB